MPNIEVRDADGHLLKTYMIFAAEYGTLVTDDDLFEMAKNNLIEDELVSDDQLDKLTFNLAK